MDHVGYDVVQKPLVVRNNHKTCLGRAKAIDPLSDNAQGVDVEAGIRFVQNGKTGLQHGHLKNFVALFLTARESLVEASAQKALVHLQELKGLAHFFKHGRSIQGLFASSSAHGIKRSLYKIRNTHARNLNRILKAQK